MCDQLAPRDESDLLRYTVAAGHGATLALLSDPLNSWGYATGNTLWTSAEELVAFFDQQYPETFFKGKRVLELGAGLGLVGMSLAKKGARVVATDRGEVLGLLRRNIAENFPASSGCAPIEGCLLEWGAPVAEWPPSCRGPFDLVVGSDLVYGTRPNYLNLLRTLAEVVRQDTLVIFAIPDRKESKCIARDLLKRQYLSRRLSTVTRPSFENPVVIYRLILKESPGESPCPPPHLHAHRAHLSTMLDSQAWASLHAPHSGAAHSFRQNPRRRAAKKTVPLSPLCTMPGVSDTAGFPNDTQQLCHPPSCPSSSMMDTDPNPDPSFPTQPGPAAGA